MKLTAEQSSSSFAAAKSIPPLCDSTFMKVLLVISMLIVFAEFGPGSSSGVTESGPPQSSPAVPDEEISRWVGKFSKQARLTNLKQLSLPDSATEIRIWMGGGVVYPRCFVLKIQKHSRNAYLVAPKVVKNRAVFRSRNHPIYVRTPLGNPRSGWDSLLDYLKGVGIYSPGGFALDKTFEPDPDQEVLALEFKTGRRYTMVFYLDSSESQDGKKALGICRKTENEFAKRIYCGN